VKILFKRTQTGQTTEKAREQAILAQLVARGDNPKMLEHYCWKCSSQHINKTESQCGNPMKAWRLGIKG